MIDLLMTQTKNLYPIYFKDKKYYKKDCDPTFKAYYSDPLMLKPDCSVYVADGDSIFPDGTYTEN